ncbi:hypothetical protein AURDEDRAFT_165013 [Auricularia subglabra TFB-10046 SS5]|nr:hypothetical protein AURDEDRAFT_165013 [Auricularia subglabra TFB-10046 SS5]
MTVSGTTRSCSSATATIFTQSVFFTLTICGGLLLVLVLATFALASAGAARNAALVNFLVGLTVGMALGPALLPLTGHMQTPEPPRTLCFFQISIVQGGVTMCGVAAIAVVVHEGVLDRRRAGCAFWRVLCTDATMKPTDAANAEMAASPGTAFVVYVLAQAEGVFAMGDRLELERGVLLCRFVHGSPFFFKSGPMVVILGSLVIVIVASVYLAIRIRDTLRLIGLSNLSKLMNDESERGLWISLLVRVFMFELVCILGAILVYVTPLTYRLTFASEAVFRSSVDTLAGLRKDGPVHLALLIVSGTMPLFAFLIFGTVPDAIEHTFYGTMATI